MRSITMITLALMLLASAALTAQGNGFGMGSHHMGQGRGHHEFKGKEIQQGLPLEELNLSDEQLDKVEKIRLNHKKEMIDLNADLKKLKLEKQEAMKDADFSEAKSVTDKIYKKKAEIEKKRITKHEAIYNVLTPEQREAAKKLCMQREPRKNGRGLRQHRGK